MQVSNIGDVIEGGKTEVQGILSRCSRGFSDVSVGFACCIVSLL